MRGDTLLVVTDRPPRSSEALEWMWQHITGSFAQGMWMWEHDAETPASSPAEAANWLLHRRYPLTGEAVVEVIATARPRAIVANGQCAPAVAAGAAACAIAPLFCVWTEREIEDRHSSFGRVRWQKECTHVCTSEQVRRAMMTRANVFSFDIVPQRLRRPRVAWIDGRWPQERIASAVRCSLVFCPSLAVLAGPLRQMSIDTHVITSYDMERTCHEIFTVASGAATFPCVVVADDSSTFAAVAALWCGVGVACVGAAVFDMCGPCALDVRTSKGAVEIGALLARSVGGGLGAWRAPCVVSATGEGRRLALAIMDRREQAAPAHAPAYSASLARVIAATRDDDARARRVGIISTWDDSGMGAQCEKLIQAIAENGVACRVLAYTGYVLDSTLSDARDDRSDRRAHFVDRVPLLREQVGPELVRAWCARYGFSHVLIIEPIARCAPDWIAGATSAGVAHVHLVCNAEWVAPGDAERWTARGARCWENWPGALPCAAEGRIGMGVRPCFVDAFELRARRLESRTHHEPVTALLVCGACADRKRAASVVRAFALCRARSEIGGSVGVRLIVSCWNTSWLDEATAAAARAARVQLHVRRLRAQELEKLREQCDVCVCVSAYEGLGMELFEAWESGQLVLTHGGEPHRRFAAEGAFGWVVPARAAGSDRGGWQLSEHDLAAAFGRVAGTPPEALCAMLRRAAAGLCPDLRWSAFSARVGLALSASSASRCPT